MAIALPAVAQQSGDPKRASARNVADDLADCRAIAEAAARLACFDRTSAALVAARERKDLVVVDRTEMRSARRSLFGFPLPNIHLFDSDGKDSEPEIKEINSTITAISDTGFRRWLITLADGSRWQTVEIVDMTPPRPGREIQVTRAPVGGYYLHLGGRTLRARRVE